MRRIHHLLVPGLVVLGLLAFAGPASGAAGDVLWFDTVFHSGVYGDDIGWTLKLDAAGNPIIAARAATGASTRELRGWSYQPTGIWRGESHFNGPGSTFDTVNDMALNGAGEPRMVGVTQGVGSGDDMFLARYPNALGALQGANYYNGPANGDDEAMAVCADTAGTTWFTGMSQGTGGDMDIATVRVDAAGVQTWAKRYNSRYDRFDAGFAITVRGSALYVAGISNRKGHGDDIVLIKYNATSGKRLWVRRYDDPLHRSENVSDVIATSTAVYLCGNGRFTATKPGQALIARYSTAGTRKWVKYFTGGGNFDEAFADMQRAPNGNIVVCGFASRKATRQDMFTAAYRTNGTLRWGKYVYSPGPRMDLANALDIDGAGRVYVTGMFEKTNLTGDVYTTCYGPTGTTQWGKMWNGADDGDDIGYDIEVFTDAVWVTGTAFVAANGQDQLTIKYEK